MGRLRRIFSLEKALTQAHSEAVKSELKRNWTREALLSLGRSYQGAAVLAAAADLDVFDAMHGTSRSAADLAHKLRCNVRGLTVVLDALTALGLLRKSGNAYSLPSRLAGLLTSNGQQSVLAMAQHQANCMRRWVELARVVKSDRPAKVRPSVRGPARDQEAFIGAMDNLSAPNAVQVIRAVQPLRFMRLLDVGGASGTWTIAFLRACPSAHATIFDLPRVIPMARRRLAASGLARRVKFVAGDFMKDPLPGGADLTWVSAIIHQNSRAQNRALFRKVSQALVPGGRIAIRDIVMQEGHTRPVAGALFAVNMLVATAGGGTFTFGELREELEHAGFEEVALARGDQGMNSVVVARKPLNQHR
jgi:SAM-dependent methyltransferase